MTNVEAGNAVSWLDLGFITFQLSQAAIFSSILLIAVILGELPKLHKHTASAAPPRSSSPSAC